MSVFERLHVGIREAIWRQQWADLRPLQVDAIHALLDTTNHVILSAATASGKTEAAFLPILSKLAETPRGSVQALYVSPLKALINDQFRRLEVLCESAQISVHRWHGDVSATEKRKLRENPNGVLLITPESLESQCINYGSTLSRIYGGLEFVVIDELHAFLEDVRGVHLQSLISRIQHVAGCSPRKVGLSATLGDYAPACRFVCQSAPDTVSVLRDACSEREVRVAVKGYTRSAALDGTPLNDLAAERSIAADIALRFQKSTNLVFFNSRGLTEEIADLLNERCREEAWSVNPFLIHHGSLSKDLREEAERDLKAGKPVTVLCTRTLEMGIDIGSVECVGQVGAPWSASSLIQRVGRSGRREGEAQVLRLYSIDHPITGKSTFTERLFPELLRAIAMVELMLRKWVETPRSERKHYSTFIHQCLSVLRQTGGIKADSLFKLLCSEGAFSAIAKDEFVLLLRHLASHKILQQMETGHIILSPEGEKIVESRDFYSAFASSVEFSIENGPDKIGVLPQEHVPPVGEHLLLAGRRWCVIDVDERAKRVGVVAARGKKTPLFLGNAGRLDREVMKEMERTLTTSLIPIYLHKDAAGILNLARSHYAQTAETGNSLIMIQNSIAWLPWAGTSVHQTLLACAKADGMKPELSRDGLLIDYGVAAHEKLTHHWNRIANGAFTAVDLLPYIPDPTSDRFDDLVPPVLLAKAYVHEILDLEGAALTVLDMLDHA